MDGFPECGWFLQRVLPAHEARQYAANVICPAVPCRAAAGPKEQFFDFGKPFRGLSDLLQSVPELKSAFDALHGRLAYTATGVDLDVLHVRRAHQLTLQVVSPSVVTAAETGFVPGSGCDDVTAVAADVRQHRYLAVLATGNQEWLANQVGRVILPWCGNLVRPSQTHPFLPKNVLFFQLCKCV